MQNNLRNPQNMSSSSLDIKRYFQLIKENVFRLILIAAVFYCAWILLFPVIYKYSPEYTTKSVVRFDDPRSKGVTSGVSEFANLGAEGKLAILHTNSFLGKVVDSLNLNLVLEKSDMNRFEFLDNIFIGKNALFGKYEIKISDKIEVFYSNKKNDISNELVFSENYNDESQIKFKYEDFAFDLKNISKINKNKIVLKLLPKRIAIEMVRKELKPKLDRSKTVLEISYTEKNAEYAARVNNTITTQFINQLKYYKRHQTSNVLDALLGQLQNARVALSNSETELRTFRENNPRVTIAAANDQTVKNLIENEKQLDVLVQDQADLKSLIDIKASDSAEKRIELLELVSFLVSKKYIGSQIFADEYNTLLGNYELLLADYSKDHPFVKEAEIKIGEFENRIRLKARNYLEKIDSQIAIQASEIKGSKALLVNLPAKELRLAELIRNREINEQIVSKILVRYNEAKIADASIVPDAYIIDYAEAPVVLLSSYFNLLRFGLGILVGFILGIIIVILIDLINPSIRTSKDIESMLAAPVLSIVPIIGKENEVLDESEIGKKINTKLITADYAPTVEGEAFRLLRTKLMLDGELAQKKTLIVTSLNPNEGKSLVSSNLAITIAQQKYSTILVDCDLRRGVLHSSFACKKNPGLSDILKNNSEINWGSISNIIQETHIPNLFLISSGTPIPNPSELLGSPRMNQIIRVLKHKFGVVLCDTAPMNYTPDAFVLNSFINNVLLVTRYGETNAQKLSEKTKEFSNLQSDLVGVVINASKNAPKHDQYSYSYYQY